MIRRQLSSPRPRRPLPITVLPHQHHVRWSHGRDQSYTLIGKVYTRISKTGYTICIPFLTSALVCSPSSFVIILSWPKPALDDIEALISGSKYIKALIPAVVNIVYRKLLQYDITSRAFQTRSTSFEGPLDEFPSEDSPQIMHRKMFLKGYLTKLCSDPSKLEFWEYLDKVG